MSRQGGLTALAAFAALAAGGALALAGCTGGDGVASLGGEKTGVGEKTQAERTRDLVECLQADGVPAELMELEDAENQAQLNFGAEKTVAWSLGTNEWTTQYADSIETEAQMEAVRQQVAKLIEKYNPDLADSLQDSPEGAGSGGGVVLDGPAAPEDQAGTWEDPAEGGDPDAEGETPAQDEPVAEPSTFEAFLIVEDQDKTEALVECLGSSGYTAPEIKLDPAQEIRDKEVRLEATAKWVKCARDHGYPDMADPPPAVADQYLTEPTALLPRDTTEPELRALLGNCPNFDAEAHQAVDEAFEAGAKKMSAAESEKLWQSLIAEHPTFTNPEIGFDVAGYDGRGTYDDTLTEADTERLNGLMEVLREAADQYYEAQDPEAD
ncbi:MAG: hypothetical protein LBL01_02335 [Bifidobacteriaceae bacterium]|jgi:hypothetical protein|nr:hypothetical protein [Bifidobacteriaceae bacterium]